MTGPRGEEGVMDEKTAQSRFKLLVRRVQETLYELETAVERGELKEIRSYEAAEFAEELSSVHHLRWELSMTRLELEAAKGACQLIRRLALMGWEDGQAQS
jgi:hypothetical protein